MRVGFAGLGRMGRRMAANCLRGGHEVAVWNRSEGPAAEFAAATGAGRADTPRALAETSEIVVTMLADDAASEEVHFGPGGLFEAEGGAWIFLEMGTMTPDHVAALGSGAGDRLVIDAPVSGATGAAEAATLTIFAGCDAESGRVALPVLETMGAPILFLGRPGAGAVMKLAVNALIHGMNQTLAEALTLAEAGGIAPETAFDAIEASAAAAPMFGYRRPLYLDEAAHDVTFTVALARKDMDAILLLARTLGVDMPQGEVTQELLRQAEARDYAPRDLAAMLAFMRDRRR